MKTKKSCYIIFFIVFCTISGCSPIQRTEEIPTTIVVTQPPILPSPTKPKPTPTLIPTLLPEVALEIFINLIEKDDLCNLPCWLGIVPGQDDFDDVVNRFSQFSAIAHTGLSSGISSQWVVIRVFFPNFESATHDIDTTVAHTENGKVSRILIAASTYQDINGPHDFNSPEFQRLMQRYFVPGIFARHGVPEKIFLDTTLIAADTATSSYPFVLWIVYPKEGFLIRYTGQNSKIGENIRICPMQSRIEIKIWDTKSSTYEEFMKGDRALGISTSLGPQPIESVTDFDSESFYKLYKAGKLDTCFETPVSLWPPN